MDRVGVSLLRLRGPGWEETDSSSSEEAESEGLPHEEEASLRRPVGSHCRSEPRQDSSASVVVALLPRVVPRRRSFFRRL